MQHRILAHRRRASLTRILLAAITGTLFLALFASLALAEAGLAREAAYHRAEARI